MMESPRLLGRRALRGVVGGGVALLPLLAQAQPSSDYIALARRYARGERAAAVAELSGWTPRRLGHELDELRAGVLLPGRPVAIRPSLPAPPLRAIVMLHTDRDALERRPSASASSEGPPRCGTRFHVDFAERVAALLIGDSAGRDFARRWHLALALRGLSEYCFDDARRLARDGLKAFPGDAQLILTSGMIEEAVGSLVAVVPSGRAVLTPSQEAEAQGQFQERLILLRKARHAFERALAADESLLPARLHLGRLRWKLEEREAARSALEEVLAQRPPADLRYLAHLFLGRVHEDDGRLAPAEQEYREALAADPSAQAAALALSCVLQLQGEPGAARTVLEGALAFAGRRNDDAFWGYLFYRTSQVDLILEDLREEASR